MKTMIVVHKITILSLVGGFKHDFYDFPYTVADTQLEYEKLRFIK